MKPSLELMARQWARKRGFSEVRWLEYHRGGWMMRLLVAIAAVQIGGGSPLAAAGSCQSLACR